MRIKNSKGITLIEVVLALAIIGTALVVFAATFNLNRVIHRAKNKNIAYHIALEKIEDLRNTNFENLPVSGPFSNSDLNILPLGSGQITVTDLDTSLKQFGVTVSWDEASSTRSVLLETLIYQNGINGL